MLGAVITSALLFGTMTPVAVAVEPIPLTLPASISADVKKKNTAHPYIMANKAQWDKIKANVVTDPLMAGMKASVLKKADAIIPKPVQPYEIPDGLRLLAASREVKDRAYTLGAAWQLTGDTKYAERLWKELDNAANYKDWNPKHFLDTAEMTNGVGVGYDWIYSYLNETQRAKIRNAIVVKGLQEADIAFAAGHSWTKSESNWNQVSNGGITVGALAIALENSPAADKTLAKTIPSSTYGIQEWGPDGGYSEGIGYWNYAMQYTVTLLASLNSSTGTDYGLSKTPGLSQAGLYPLYMQGPNRIKTAFNYGDEYPSVNHMVDNLYLGKLYQNPLYTQLGLNLVKGATADPKALIWYDPTASAQTPTQANIPLDKYFRTSETVSFSSAWDQPNATYSAFKGRGKTSVGHADLDLGTFVMSSLDETWAVEMGRDEFTYAGNLTADRWEFYRKRAEAHNTLVFNPQSPAFGATKADQNVDAIAKISSFSSGIRSSYAIADLTQADKNLVSWKRGIKQFDNKEQVLIQDEVKGQASLNDAWWFMHTEANIEVASDGKSAILSKPNGKKLLARIISSDTTLAFTSTEAAAFPTSPSTNPQTANTGIRKLAINIAGKKDFTLAVQLTPIRVDTVTPVKETIQALSTWTPAPTVAGSAQLKNISVNGKPLAGFTPQTVSYDVANSYPSLPQVTVEKVATTDTVTIAQSKTQAGKATITVSAAGKSSTVYNIWFENTDRVASSVTASTVASATEGPDKTVDSDKTTKWTSWGDQWIQYDFGSTQPLKNMDIAWGGNAARYVKYEIQTSVDGVTWKTAKDAAYTVVNTTEKTALNISARYVRINVHGDTLIKKDLYSSIYEVRFYEDFKPSTLYNTYVSGVKTSVASKDIKVGETFKNVLTGYKADGNTISLTGTTTKYTSSDPTIATVDSAGTVKGVSEGTAKIMIKTWSSPGRTTSYTGYIVNVDDPNKFMMKPTADTWVSGGENSSLTTGGTSKILFNKDSSALGSSTDRKAYVQFQLPDLTGYEVVSAKLSFNAYINDGNGTATDTYVNPAKGTINENTTNFTNRPLLGAAVGKVYVSGPDASYTVDITEYMKTQDGGATKPATFGFSQITKYGMNTYIASKETTTPPTLVVIVKKVA